MKVVGTSQNNRGGESRHMAGFRQTMVEDVFSYARHNRVDDLERMMDQ